MWFRITIFFLLFLFLEHDLIYYNASVTGIEKKYYCCRLHVLEESPQQFQIFLDPA